jgi:hypothetical protein
MVIESFWTKACELNSYACYQDAETELRGRICLENCMEVMLTP